MPEPSALDVDLFPLVELPADELAALVSRIVGEDVVIDDVAPARFPYNWGAISTAGLWRVDVTGHTRTASVDHPFFVKLLRHPRHWPHLDLIPAGRPREDFVNAMPWKIELDLQESGIADMLPPGLRTAELHAVHWYDDEHVALWSEYVEQRPGGWDVCDYEQAAFLLGRLAARRRLGAAVNERLPDHCRDFAPGGALRYYTEHRVLLGMAPRLRDGGSWQHPILVEALKAVDDPRLPTRMLDLLDRIPAMLDMLERLPQTYAHGDASPQNLLVPVDAPDTRVVIDWGFGTPLPVGFDLGQLLVGLANAQVCDVDLLPLIVEAIVPAYTRGLAQDGYVEDPEVVRTGLVGSLATRSALVALPFEILDRPHEGQLDGMWVNQLRLTRYLLDLAATLP